MELMMKNWKVGIMEKWKYFTVKTALCPLPSALCALPSALCKKITNHAPRSSEKTPWPALSEG